MLVWALAPKAEYVIQGTIWKTSYAHLHATERQHSVGAEDSPVPERRSHSAEPQPSLKGQMRRGDQNESYQRNERTHGQGTAGGLRNAGQHGEASQEHGTCCAGFACWIGRYTAFLKEKIEIEFFFFLMNKRRQYAGRFQITWEWDQSLLVKIKFQRKEGVGVWIKSHFKQRKEKVFGVER